MKASLFLASAGAILAAAGPLEKRKMVTDVEVVWVTDTVTAGAEPTSSSAAFGDQSFETTTQAPVVVTTTVDPSPTYTPEPMPTTSSASKPSTTFVVQPMPTTILPEPSTTETPTSTSKTYVAQPTEPAQDDLQGMAIYHHNVHRSNHSAPAVSWNDEITSYAQSTADTCVFAHDMDEGNGGYGQNLAMYAVSSGASSMEAGHVIAMAISDMWYEEESSYTGYGEATPNMDDFEAWGHYSQLVWKDSTTVGCAIKLCPSGSMVDGMDAWLMVCNYQPVGNMGGQYGKNVGEPLGMAAVTV